MKVNMIDGTKTDVCCDCTSKNAPKSIANFCTVILVFQSVCRYTPPKLTNTCHEAFQKKEPIFCNCYFSGAILFFSDGIIKYKVVVSNILYFHPLLGEMMKWSNLTNTFQKGWSHQLEYVPSLGLHFVYQESVSSLQAGATLRSRLHLVDLAGSERLSLDTLTWSYAEIGLVAIFWIKLLGLDIIDI